MSGTSHRALRADAVALLQAASALLGVTVTAGRRRPMASNVTRQVNVDVVESIADEGTTNEVEWRSRLLAECSARDTAEATADEAVDTLLEAVYAVLMSQAGMESLGAAECTPLGLAWHTSDDDTSVAAATASFHVHHSTTAASIAA